MTEVQDDTIRLACWDCCAVQVGSAGSIHVGEPPAINRRRGITLAGVFSAGSAGEQSERSVACRGSILNGQN
jgi:hypothetical protein